MREDHIEVTSKHGAIPSFMVRPQDDGQWPAIIFYMDAPGIREELRNMARRIASNGYVCILPDLYHRYGTLRFDTHRRNDAMGKVISAAYLALSDTDINEDTAGLLGFLAAQAEVKPGPVGSIGFCMSGRFVTTTAMAFPGRFAAAASLYGTRLVVDEPDSPHRRLVDPGTAFYYGFGSADVHTPRDYIETFRAAADEAEFDYEMEVFEGADHGYSFVERAPYDPTAAEQSWSKVFALFDRTLR